MKEGRIKFFMPKKAQQKLKGPYRASGTGVFYNPQMEISRDLTVAVLENYFKDKKAGGKKLKFLDGLAGTGIRGLRLASELSFAKQNLFIINDGNHNAVDLIEKNIEMNSLQQNTKVLNESLNTLLTSSKYDYIDIDPFGTPILFIDNAVLATKPGGLLAITATDTAPLSGTYPSTCIRRYGAVPKKNEYMHESGLRILMGAVAKTAGKYDLSVEPVLIYYMDYYFRLYLKLVKGAKAADKMLKNVGYITENKISGSKTIEKIPQKIKNHHMIGPLWTGPLNDKKLIKSIMTPMPNLKSKTRLKKYCKQWIEEGELPPWFFDINLLASKLKIQPMKFMDIKKNLKRNGFKAVQTHFSPQGFKTDAAMDDLRNIL